MKQEITIGEGAIYAAGIWLARVHYTWAENGERIALRVCDGERDLFAPPTRRRQPPLVSTQHRQPGHRRLSDRLLILRLTPRDKPTKNRPRIKRISTDFA